jgi:hypothetical protein
MALYDDTGKTCVDCNTGTYVEYLDGIKCRYCGEPQKRRTVTTRGKKDE